jgi:hypothetical protein
MRVRCDWSGGRSGWRGRARRVLDATTTRGDAVSARRERWDPQANVYDLEHWTRMARVLCIEVDGLEDRTRMARVLCFEKMCVS